MNVPKQAIKQTSETTTDPRREKNINPLEPLRFTAVRRVILGQKATEVMLDVRCSANELSPHPPGGRPVRTKSRRNESLFRSNATHVFVLLGFRSDGISFQRDGALQRVAY